LGVQFIEPVYIAKYDPLLQESYFTDTNATTVLRQIRDAGLKVRSVASHMDMGLTDTVDVFRRRMNFAKTLGAGIIITNTSRLENREQFFKNMETLSRTAEEMELVIALENPGDGFGYIMNNAAEGAAVVRELHSAWIKLNYDFSNIHTLSKGADRYDTGLAEAIPDIAHLHLKNVKRENDQWPVCSLPEGIVDYRKVFHEYPALRDLPVSIELPVRFGYDRDFNFLPREGGPPALEEICGALQESILFLNDVV